MADLVCLTCGAANDSHQLWCSRWNLLNDLRSKDRRIAELQAENARLRAALERLLPAPDIQEVLAGNCDALDAALAAAKREALEAAAKWFLERPPSPFWSIGVCHELRRMAREVQP